MPADTTSILSEHRCGDMMVRYMIDEATRRVGLWMLPVEMMDQVAARRRILETAAARNLFRGREPIESRGVTS